MLNANIILQGRDPNAIQAQAQGVSRNAFALDQARQQAPAQNALATAQAQGAQMNIKDQEYQIAGQLLEQVEKSQDKNRAYQQALQVAQQRGLDIAGAPQEYDEEWSGMVRAMAAKSPEERSALERMISQLPPEHQEDAFLVATGLKAGAANPTVSNRFYVLATSKGLLKFDRQDGTWEIINQNATGTLPQSGQQNGQQQGSPLMSPGADPSLQGQIAGAREAGKDAAVGRPKRFKAARQAMDNLQAKQDVVSAKIDEALNSLSGFNTGIAGQLFSGVGGTGAHDLKGTLDTIKANVGFDQLQAMRDASPTGGALGQVSEQENRLLQSVLGSLEQSQRQEQLAENLQNLKQVLTDMRAKREAAFREDFANELGVNEQQSQQQSPQQEFEVTRELNGQRYGKRNGKWFVIP